MMETTKIVETTIINKPSKFILFVILFFVGGIALTMFLFFKTNSIVILFCGMLFFVGYPTLFEKRFRRRFTQIAAVSFTEEYFAIEFRDTATYAVSRTDINRFDQIQQFSTTKQAKSDFSKLTLFYKDGSKISYSFSGQYGYSLNEKNINGMVKQAIADYNLAKSQEEKIMIATRFITTKAGLYSIIGFILIMVAFLIYVFFLNPGAVPVLAIFIFLISYIMLLERNKAAEEKARFNG